VTHTILIVDDETRLAEVLAAALENFGHRPIVCSSASDALDVMAREEVDLIISDLRMKGMDGRELLHAIHRKWPDIPVVLMTAFTSVRDAVELIKEGAFDYVAKPFEISEIEATVARALKLNDVIRDNLRLRSELEERYRFDQLIGTSQSFRQVIEQIAEVCESKATVLLTGESGTGKEVISRAIHFASPRRLRPFVAVNCAAIPEGLLESELFGHVKGAFTGAVANRQGRFAAAEGGTLLLDEIGDMPQAVQVKILRALQERTIEPVGSTQSQSVDVRVIAATHKDLKRAVADGTFREDLYYRLNVFPIALPPLRERMEDLSLLAQHFLEAYSESMGKKIVAFTPGALASMANYRWPGNIRELQNCIERAVIVARSATVDVPDLPPYIFDLTESGAPATRVPNDLDAELVRQERAFVLEALQQSGGVQVRAAELLGISERSLWHRIKKLGIRIAKTAD
jgi:two-component system, NtrC family, response regulator AtoC